MCGSLCEAKIWIRIFEFVVKNENFEGREGKRRVLMRGDVEGALEHGFILKDDLARSFFNYFFF